MNRVLLYEPFNRGHRSNILKILEKAYRRNNWEVIVHTGDCDNQEPQLADLCEYSWEKGCVLLHICTLDDHLRRFLRAPRNYLRKRPVKIVANYYLYYNLESGLKRTLILESLSLLGIHIAFISDRLIADNAGNDRLKFVPDPWDPDDFKVVSRQDARIRLNLPIDAKIFLMIGGLSKRKGLEILLQSCKYINWEHPNNALLLLAGRIDPELAHCLEESIIRTLVADGHIKIFNERIPEDMYSSFFSATDVVVCPYLSWFRASSGTLTLAIASHRPVIGPSTGNISNLISDNAIGWTFRCEDPKDLAFVINRYLHGDLTSSDSAFGRMAEESSIDTYGHCIQEAIKRIC